MSPPSVRIDVCHKVRKRKVLTSRTLACLPHYTSGQTYFYPAFNASRTEDAIKFAHEFGEVLAMPIMLEAVMRVRASKSKVLKEVVCYSVGLTPFVIDLRMSSFHGNFFVRSTDLLAMPAVPQDQSYAIEVTIEDTITAPFVVFQTAVLHTTCYGSCAFLRFIERSPDCPIGERRIRVVTLALPTTSNLSEVFASADQVAIATLLANKAVERSITHKLEDARDALFSKMVEILQAYKQSMTAGGAGASAQLAISDNLKMLPVLVLGLLKNVSFSLQPCGGKSWAESALTHLGWH